MSKQGNHSSARRKPKGIDIYLLIGYTPKYEHGTVFNTKIRVSALRAYMVSENTGKTPDMPTV